MPTTEYKSIEHAWQALTDIEIEDDENNFPVAKIKLRGLFLGFSVPFTAKIQMVSEWDYFEKLAPMRVEILNYYVSMVGKNSNDEKVTEQITKKLAALMEDVSTTARTEPEKAEQLQSLMNEKAVRIRFYKGLKELGILPWWLTIKSAQKSLRIVDLITLFAFLWLFNFDGVKKNSFLILSLIKSSTNFHLPTVGISSGNQVSWEDRKKLLQEAFVKSISKN
jgi:hypothetical protein